MSEEKKQTRRDYVKTVGSFIAGAVVASAAWGAYEVSKPPAPAPGAAVTTTKTETVTGPGGVTTVTVSAVPTPKYTYYFPSHIGPDDPNMYWLTVSIEDIAKRYPVKTVYQSISPFSIPEHVKLVEAALAAKPDGLIVPITSPESLEGVLGRAIDAGIPVIASNIPDPRPERIKYLTYVGAAEYPTGYKVNERAFELIGVDKIKKSVTFVHSPGHVGHEERARGHADICKKLGIPYEKVAADPTVEKSYDIMRSYLLANTNVNHCFVTAGWIARAAKNAAEINNRAPGVDFWISSVDESPFVLEPIREGWVIDTHSQQFYLQGYYPPQWLYMYNEHGYLPPFDGTVGPVVIDKTNVERWKKICLSVFGEQLYNDLSKH